MPYRASPHINDLFFTRVTRFFSIYIISVPKWGKCNKVPLINKKYLSNKANDLTNVYKPNFPFQGHQIGCLVSGMKIYHLATLNCTDNDSH
jgi:hypothetical protein